MLILNMRPAQQTIYTCNVHYRITLNLQEMTLSILESRELKVAALTSTESDIKVD